MVESESIHLVSKVAARWGNERLVKGSMGTPITGCYF